MPQLVGKGYLKWTPPELKKLNEVYRNVYYRLHNRDQNFLIVFVGRPGAGKSYAALRFCEQIDPNFDVDRNVVFEPEELLELVNNKKLYNGAAILWEEVGVGISAREWYSTVNKQINHLMQTFRKKHICLVMTVPDITFIDNNVRKIINAIGLMTKIDRQKKQSWCAFRYVDFDAKSGQMYYKRPVFVRRDTGRMEQWDYLIMPKVDEELAKKYEKKRAEFTEKLGLEVQNEIELAKRKKQKPISLEQALRIVSEDPDKFRNANGDIDETNIELELNMGRTRAMQIKRYVKAMLGE